MTITDAFLIIKEHQTSMPVDVNSLIRALGIELCECPFDDDISGTIELQKNGAYLICINESHSTTRKRFTAAHELGHYIFHRDQIDRQCIVDNRLYRSTNSKKYNNEIGKAEETQANQFAANLLMPLHLVQKLKEKGLSSEEMAGELGVSKQAMQIRYDSIFHG